MPVLDGAAMHPLDAGAAELLAEPLAEVLVADVGLVFGPGPPVLELVPVSLEIGPVPVAVVVPVPVPLLADPQKPEDWASASAPAQFVEFPSLATCSHVAVDALGSDAQHAASAVQVAVSPEPVAEPLPEPASPGATQRIHADMTEPHGLVPPSQA